VAERGNAPDAAVLLTVGVDEILDQGQLATVETAVYIDLELAAHATESILEHAPGLRPTPKVVLQDKGRCTGCEIVQLHTAASNQ
jgi:hypothetical protein